MQKFDKKTQSGNVPAGLCRTILLSNRHNWDNTRQQIEMMSMQSRSDFMAALPIRTEPMAVLTAGLVRMEAYLDKCLEVFQDNHFRAKLSLSDASIEQKVKVLFFDSYVGLFEDENVTWLGKSVLDTKALLLSLETEPVTSDQKISGFLTSWGAEADAQAWTGKSDAENLHQLMQLICSAVEGFYNGVLECCVKSPEV